MDTPPLNDQVNNAENAKESVSENAADKSRQQLHRPHTLKTVLIGLSLILISTVGFVTAWVVASNVMPFVDDFMSRTTGNGDPVMTILGETIYSKEELTDDLIERFAKESLTLQAGAELGLITLNDSIYNSEHLNKDSRAKAIETVEETFKKSTKYGTILSVWFGYFVEDDESYASFKSSAQAILSSTRNKLANGDIDIAQAINILKQNETIQSFADYRNENPSMMFSAFPSLPITYDPEFDDAIHRLEHGDITEVYEVTDFLSGSSDREIVGYSIAVADHYDNVKAQDAFDSWITALLYSIDDENTN